MSDQDKLQLIYENTVEGKLLSEMSYGVSDDAGSMSTAELVDFIKEEEKTGTNTVSFTFVLKAYERKKQNPFLPMYKVSQVSTILGPDYGAGVNRDRKKVGLEPDYVPQAMKGKEHVTRTIIKNQSTGALMMAIQPTHTKSPTYIGTDPDTGKLRILDRVEWRPFIRETKPYIGPSGVERNFKTYGINGVIGFTANGSDTMIDDVDPLKQEVWDLVKDTL
jgi:hypothetical protein